MSDMYLNATRWLALILLPVYGRGSQKVVDGLEHHLDSFEALVKKYRIKFPTRAVSSLIGLAKSNKSTKYHSMMREVYKQFGPTLKSKAANDKDFPSYLMEPFSFLLRVMGTREIDTAIKAEVGIPKRVHVLSSGSLNSLWLPQVGSQENVKMNLEALVKRITGKSRTFLTLDEAKELREKNEEKNKLYNSLRREAKVVMDGALRNFIISEGGQPQPVKKVRQALEGMGISIHPFRKELDPLNVDADGRLYTRQGKYIPSFPTPSASISFNPDYNPKKDDTWIFKYNFNNANSTGDQYAYTLEAKQRNTKDRFEVVNADKDALPKARKRWINDMKAKDFQTSGVATMAELLYSFGMRIGGDGYTQGVGKTYGLSTLLCKHIRPYKNGIKIEYPGKKGMKQTHVIRPDGTPERAQLLKNMLHWMSNPDFGPSDEFWDGITPGEVNAYLKKVGLNITAHKMRHLLGNATWDELVEKDPLPKKATQAQAEQKAKKLAEQVGEKLGHFTAGGAKTTGTTSLKNYLDPEKVENYFTSQGFRVPAWLLKAGKKMA